MKFCKDCKNYSPAISTDGGTLLPGVFFCLPAQCIQGVAVNLITGEKIPKMIDCSKCRDDEVLCGPHGWRFDPVTLDGRLAMLEESK